jgi:O-antigen ligase
MLKVKTTLKKFNPELIFVSYFWGFILLRPLLQAFESISTIILFTYVLILISIFMVGMILMKESSLGEAVFLVLFFLFFFFLDAIFRNNNNSYDYIYKYVYCGVIPVLFLSKIRNVDKLLKYFIWFSLFSFLLYGADPLLGNKIFSGYMDYGFNLVMPAFFGLFIGCHYFRLRWLIVFELICLSCILIFANRSALLSVVLFGLLYFIFTSPDRKKILIRWVLPGTILLVVFLLNIETIIRFIYQKVVIDFEISSYSIVKLMDIFENDNSSGFFSGRLEIWSDARNMIKESPIFGHGIGSFQSRYGIYTHNLYYDIVVFFGLIGLIVFCLIIFLSIWTIWSSNKSIQVLGLLFFSLWFPKLFLSTYFFEDIGFWCFLSLPFIIRYINQRHITNQVIDQ